MRKIKKYQEFTNEEIDIKKALLTGAVSASMALGNTPYSTNTKDLRQNIQTSNYANLPIDGWDKAKWGMSKEEISKLYNIKSDDIVLLDYSVNSDKYNVSFIFNGDKLDEVRLELIYDYESSESVELDDIRKSIEEKIESKYGDPSMGGGVSWSGRYYQGNVTSWVGKYGKLEVIHVFSTISSINYDRSSFNNGITLRYKKIDSSGY